MTMFNITDGNNNVSRDKPVEHSDLVIGLHVSARGLVRLHKCPHVFTPGTRMRARYGG